MNLFTTATQLAGRRGSVIAAIGVFDGVHIGHRTILREMVAHAAALRLTPVAITFEPHPDAVLPGGHASDRLTGPADKAGLVRGLGVEAVVALPFDRDFAALGAEEFVARHLVEALAPRHIYVGFNFTFGARGTGTAHTLEQLGHGAGFGVRVFGPLLYDGAVVSSTRVRQALAEGNVSLATRLLGRPHRSEGVVVPGDHRGTGLGFPTANVAIPAGLAVPGPGVYAAWASVASRSWPAVVNIGSRPTFRSDGSLAVEAHLIGYAGGALYGRGLELLWISRLREERRYPSAAELVAQIEQDVRRGLAMLRPVNAQGSTAQLLQDVLE